MIKQPIILFLLLCSSAFAQNSNWTSVSPFEHKAFIENKGQFDWQNNRSGKATLFGASLANIDVEFSASGLTYTNFELKESKRKGKENREEQEKEKIYRKIPHHTYLEWVGANTNCEVIPEYIENHYFTYSILSFNSGKSSLKAAAYKKLTYKNIYPNIDLEYSFPEDKPGIKYTFVLHPGADVSVIKMKYTGDKKISLDAQGNISLKLYSETILDHAPVSFYENNKAAIKSSFVLDRDVVTFNLSDYDKSKTVIIDPWTIVPTFLGYNAAYDVEYDLQGNVYVYGGRGSVATPFQEIKYNNAGVMQWVFTWATPVISPSYGDFAVDGASGSSYIVEGYNPPVPMVLKINSAGTQTAIYAGNVWMNEMWRIEYNNCTKNMVIAGGGTGGTTFQAATIDTNLTVMTAYNVLSATTDLHDISLLAIDNTGNYYMASAKSVAYPTVLDNVFLKGPAATILPRAYMLPDNHAFIEVGSIGYINNSGVSSPTAYANGFNGMAVSAKYVYTYDGSTIRRWRKSNGAFMNSAVLDPSPFWWGGLAVDECDNIFAGVQKSIVQLDTNFTTIATTVVPDFIYDVQLAPGNLLYACGKAFVSSFNVTLPTCSSFSATVASTGSCAQGSATVTPTGGAAPYSYSWSPSGQTTQIATGLATGNYSVTVFDNACNPTGLTLTVAVTSGGIISTITATPAACLQSNGSATVTPSGGAVPFTYSWSPSGGTNASASGLSPGVSTVTITDATSCTGTSTVSVTSIGGATVTPSSQNNISCFGGSNGSATFTASGGTAPYTYSWLPSGGNSATASGLSGGTYTIQVTDGSGCTQSETVTITQPTAISTSATSTQASCGSNNGTATVSASGGTGAYTYSWTPSGGNAATATGLAAGNYSALVTDANGCTKTQTVTVTQPSSVSATASNTQTGCNSNTGTATVVGSGGATPYTYSWSPTGGSAPTATGLAAGSYTATVTDASGCSMSVVTVVTAQPGPTANAGASVSIVSGNSTTLVGTGGGTYSWTPTGSLSCTTCTSPSASPAITTTYTLIVADANGCTDTALVTVFVQPVSCDNKPNAGSFYLPNAFSPNDDGQNDELCLLGWDECLKDFSIKIYNRWGEAVFSSDTKTFCWDGTHNGKPLNSASFAFFVKAVLYNGVKKELKGSITLVR